MSIRPMGLSPSSAAGAYVPKGTRAAAPTTATGLLYGYNPTLHAYNLKASNTRKLRAALTASILGTTQCRIGCIGDSTTQGVSAASMYSWPFVMKAALAAKGAGNFPSAGNGWVPPIGQVYDLATAGGYFTYTGTWASWASPKTHFVYNHASGTLNFASTAAGTVVEVVYLGSSGAFTVSIDGGAAVGVSGGGSTLQTYTVSGLANTTHTVLITANASADTYIAAVSVRQATTSGGVLLFNGGISGAKTSDWVDLTYYAALPTMTYFAPHCTIVNLTINDILNGVALATTKANLQTIITRAKTLGDVVLMTANPLSGAPDPTGYIKAQYELADTNDLPLLDLYDFFGSYAAANAAGYMSDTYHPNATGNAAIGAWVGNALLSVLDAALTV